MKKIYLAALTLAMTACVSNDDLNPVDIYGYIDVNVSNDPIVETRTTPTSVNINNKNWFVTIGQTEYTGSNQAFTAFKNPHLPRSRHLRCSVCIQNNYAYFLPPFNSSRRKRRRT